MFWLTAFSKACGDEPPSVDFSSTLCSLIELQTWMLPIVQYTCEIVGWDDKRTLDDTRRRLIETVMQYIFSKREEEYTKHAAQGRSRMREFDSCSRRMRQLSVPFSVSELVNTSVAAQFQTYRRYGWREWVYWSDISWHASEWLNDTPERRHYGLEEYL